MAASPNSTSSAVRTKHTFNHHPPNDGLLSQTKVLVIGPSLGCMKKVYDVYAEQFHVSAYNICLISDSSSGLSISLSLSLLLTCCIFPTTLFFFQADERRLELLDKFKSLKSAGRLKKALEKRRRNNLTKVGAATRCY